MYNQKSSMHDFTYVTYMYMYMNYQNKCSKRLGTKLIVPSFFYIIRFYMHTCYLRSKLNMENIMCFTYSSKLKKTH